VALWDTQASPHTSCVATLLHHQAAVTGLATIPGGRLLASGDDSGALLVTDLRSTGAGGNATGGRSIWEARERHTGGVTAVAAGTSSGGVALLASGGRDGTVRLWNAARGTPLQTIQTATYSRARGFFADALQQHRHEVTDLQFVDDGLMVCGMDGAVRFFPFTPA